MDETSRTLGWLAGRIIAGQRSRKKIPTAYLYNGVQLPALPEWDREKYPYAFISSGKYLDVSSDKLYGQNDKWLYVHAGTKLFQWVLVDGEWVSDGDFEVSSDSGIIGIAYLTWTSYDILNTDGTLAFAASEPVPVYA